MTDMGFFDLRDMHRVPDRAALASADYGFHGRSVTFNTEVRMPWQFPCAYGEFLMKSSRPGN
jgi:hypothetical protein